MARDNCGGEVVKPYKNHFLRDDTEIRREAGMEPVEAYSLFCDEPYGRVTVFAGPKYWAIQQADDLVDLIQTNPG